MKVIRIGKIQRILIGALLIRLTALLIIFVFTPDWSSGFLSNYTSQDDVRYEMGAIKFSETASSIFDYDAFSNAYSSYGDYVGMVRNVFSATPLWYWIVCITYYIFHSIVVVRLLNILFSVIAVSLLYRLVTLLYEEETAYTASKLLAFLPYPVVFSCFSYKDTLVMVLTIYFLYMVIDYRINKQLGPSKIIKIVFTALALMLVRGGLSAILIVLCLAIGFFTGEKLQARKAIQRGLLMAIASVAAVYILSSSMGSISLRVQSYITGRDITDLGGISLVTITSFRDLYKLPLTFLFAIVMPIGFSGTFTSWFSIVSLLNICMAPIAIGSAIDLFIHKKDEWMVLGCCLVYYIVSIVASTGIFRHYYSLLFVPIMLCAHLKHYGGGNSKNFWKIGSVLYTIIIAVYMIR